MLKRSQDSDGASAQSPNGHNGGTPEGNEGVFARGFDRGGGAGEAPSDKYMDFSSDSPDRAFPQTIFKDERHLKRTERMVMGVQYDDGLVDLEEMIVIDMAAQLGLKGIARQQALQVDTGQQGMMSKAKQWLLGATPETTQYKERGVR